MTERFSPEYIAFILSDEAKGLQKQWEPAVCDWCLAGNTVAAEGLGYVARWQVADDNGSHRTTWVVVVTPDSGIGYIGGGSQELIRQGFVWLPTLTDSLDMIEEAGFWWSTGLDYDYDGDDRWYNISAGSIEAGGRMENDDEDRMLVAAKLAVRVLEKNAI